MYQDLQGQTVVITGAATGLGEAMARRFGQEQANVVINYYSNNQNVQPIIDEIKLHGGQAIGVQGDVSKEADVQKLVQAAHEHFGSWIS